MIIEILSHTDMPPEIGKMNEGMSIFKYFFHVVFDSVLKSKFSLDITCLTGYFFG